MAMYVNLYFSWLRIQSLEPLLSGLFIIDGIITLPIALLGFMIMPGEFPLETL